MEDLGIVGFPSWAEVEVRMNRSLRGQTVRIHIRKLCKMMLGLVTTAFLASLCSFCLISQAAHTCSDDRLEAGRVGLSSLEGKAYRGQARASASLDDFRHTNVLNPRKRVCPCS